MYTFTLSVHSDNGPEQPEYLLIGETNPDGSKFHRLTRANDPRAYNLNQIFPFGLNAALGEYDLRLTTKERERMEVDRIRRDKAENIREQIIQYYADGGDQDRDESDSWLTKLNALLMHLGMEEHTPKNVYTAKVYTSRRQAESGYATPILTMRIEAEDEDRAQELAQETMDDGTSDLGSNIDLNVDMNEVFPCDDDVDIVDSAQFELDAEALNAAIEEAVQRMHIVITEGEE